MNDKTPTRGWLVKEVLALQLKLLLGAARDLVLTPVTLAAAAIDFVLIKNHPPRFFRTVLQLGQRSDEWIDTWSAAREPHEETPRENVDALLRRVEEVVGDPAQGARRARVLKRWAERQVAKARAKQRTPAEGTALEPERK
jgi:hypothetical protein